jgi:Spy/CpxP family protein refolding chaperone
MLKMKKTLGILLAVCFVLSVTAAAVSAAPYGYKYDGKNRFDNHDDKKHKYFNLGHWGHKKVKHYKDRFHKYFWYSYERYWISGYWSWE